MVKATVEMNHINPENVRSVANGRIKTVDLTTDMLADFESFKKKAEALYGTADDPYKSGSETSGVLYGFRLTDVDPASWLPQWVEANGNTEVKPTAGASTTPALRDRMQSLFFVKNESGSEQAKWSSRVLQDWLEGKLPATTVSDGPKPVDVTL